MKRIFTILILIITTVFNLHSQSYKFALFNNIKISTDSSANLLKEKIKSLNDNPEFEFIIIRGNLTSHGYADELDLVKSIFNNGKIPYYILPGSNDIEKSRSFGADYKLNFLKKSFAFEKDSIFHIGIRGIEYELGNGFHLPPEEIKRLKKVRDNIPTNKLILLYPNYPLQQADNGRQIKNIFAGRKLFIIEPTKESNSYILTIQNDSVYSANNLLDSSSVNLQIEEKIFEPIDSTGFIDYSDLEDEKILKLKANVIWQNNLETETPNNVLISKDNLFVVSRSGVIYNLDLKNNIKWTRDLDEIVISKPIIIKDILVVATAEGDLLTIRASTGEVIQSIGIDDALTTRVLKTKINYYGEETDAVIVGSGSGTFYCYTLKKLELVWSNVFSEDKIVTEPLSVKHRIIFGSKDGYLYSFDERTGVLYWKWKPEKVKSQIVDFSNPVSDGRNIFVSTSEGIIYKIDLLLGTTLWKTDKYKASFSLGLSSTGKTVITKTTDGKIILLYSKTGKKYGGIKLKLRKDFVKHTPIEWNRNFIVSSDVGKVYLIDKKYKYKPLFFLGDAALNSVQKVNDNTFIVSNIDGNIVLFSLR